MKMHLKAKSYTMASSFTWLLVNLFSGKFVSHRHVSVANPGFWWMVWKNWRQRTADCASFALSGIKIICNTYRNTIFIIAEKILVKVLTVLYVMMLEDRIIVTLMLDQMCLWYGGVSLLALNQMKSSQTKPCIFYC